MSDISHERTIASGPVVRIRRVSTPEPAPVRAVITLDRRAGTLRAAAGGAPLPLMAVAGASDAQGTVSLLPFADEDLTLARLTAQREAR